MMDATDLFSSALGLSSPWKVDEVRFAPDHGEIHFALICGEKRLPCPVCEETNQPNDRKARSWQQLHFFRLKRWSVR